MEKSIKDFRLDDDLDIVINEDIELTRSAREHVIIALTTARAWWANKYSGLGVGGDLKSYLDRSYIEEGFLRKIKSYIKDCLRHLELSHLVIDVVINKSNVFLKIELKIDDEDIRLDYQW